MTIGPGRYDDLCTKVRAETEADAVIVIVVGGKRGHGFSCQSDFATMLALPTMLEELAQQIRKDADDGGHA